MTMRSEQDPQEKSSDTGRLIQQPNGVTILITPYGPRSTDKGGTPVSELPKVKYPTYTPVGDASEKMRRTPPSDNRPSRPPTSTG